jgi:hypothetical protein
VPGPQRPRSPPLPRSNHRVKATIDLRPNVQDAPPRRSLRRRHKDERRSLTSSCVACFSSDFVYPGPTKRSSRMVPNGPPLARMEPMVRVELERVEALELLGMTLAHLNLAEARVELSPRIPLLMAIRDKLALALREDA